MSWSSKDWRNNNLIRILCAEGLPHLPASHPSRVTIRAGSLALALAVLPSLAPLLTSRKARKSFRLSELVKREAGPNGFPFALLVVFGGSAWLEWAWAKYDEMKKSESLEEEEEAPRKGSKWRTFVCTLAASLWAIRRLQKHPKAKGEIAELPLMLPVNPKSSQTSPSLDLTIIFAVRALDAIFQRAIRVHSLRRRPTSEGGKPPIKLTEHLDVLLFTLATSRIMWCYFYQPFRLPGSYVQWISALAEIDERLLLALRALRKGTFRYGKKCPESQDILMSHARDLGYPENWGDPYRLPPMGGAQADKVWQQLGVRSRPGRGGIPCELVHGDLHTSSCTTNAATRWVRAFMKATLIYFPVHVIPTLLVNPTHLLNDPFTVIHAISRSSAFLATFVGTIWYTICLSRTVVGPALFPKLPQQIIDGPFGAIALGCFTCCFSLYIERGKRRGEIALYVLPRAVRTLFKESWLRSRSRSVQRTERLAFAFACAALVTFAKHDQASLRGLSRWALGFIYGGWDALANSKRRKEISEDSPEDTIVVREPVPPNVSSRTVG
ncbi:hypothetical protein CPB86DRAFT_267323 [Serendipita vermifera]|nr:hypothetical protein CPB86DRAFT_267323 [Serendipita vermifera]